MKGRRFFCTQNEEEKVMIIPTIDMIRTGENINRLRQDAGISVRELQEVFGFATPQAIYKWQHGTTLPTIDNLVVLARILGVSMEDILVLEEHQISMSA
jgi:transcriptional regulator with XRE-family HTH domain